MKKNSSQEYILGKGEKRCLGAMPKLKPSGRMFLVHWGAAQS